MSPSQRSCCQLLQLPDDDFLQLSPLFPRPLIFGCSQPNLLVNLFPVCFKGEDANGGELWVNHPVPRQFQVSVEVADSASGGRRCTTGGCTGTRSHHRRCSRHPRWSAHRSSVSSKPGRRHFPDRFTEYGRRSAGTGGSARHRTAMSTHWTTVSTHSCPGWSHHRTAAKSAGWSAHRSSAYPSTNCRGNGSASDQLSAEVTQPLEQLLPDVREPVEQLSQSFLPVFQTQADDSLRERLAADGSKDWVEFTSHQR